MSRTIGGHAQWGTAKWGIDTWAVTDAATTLMTRLLEDPAITAGVPLKAGSSLRLVVEMLAPGAGAKWGTAQWGVDTWADTVGDWLDISSRVRGIDWQNGTTDPVGKATVGVGTVSLENDDGLMSPWATSGAYTVSGVSLIRGGRIVRWGVIDARTSVYYPIFTGKTEDTPETLIDNADGEVALSLVETTDDLSVIPDDEQIATGRLLTETLWKLLVDADWRYGQSFTAPDENAYTCSALLQNASAAERIGKVCDGLHWDFCADGRGQILVFRRHLSSTDPVAEFSNNPTGSQLPMVSAVPYSNKQRVLNRVSAAVTGGATVTVDDTKSQDQFGIISAGYGFPETELVLQDEAAVTFLAQRVLSLRAWDDFGISTMSLDADQNPSTMLPALVQLACFARDQRAYSVAWTHPGSGETLRETVSIEGQHHVVTMEGTQVKWTADLSVGHSGEVSG